MKNTVRFFAVSIAVLALAIAASGQQSAGKKKAPAASAKPKSIHGVAAKPVTATKSTSKTAASTTKTRASKAGTKSRRPAVARRPPTQQQPTADRYKEIQHALVEKGYFHGPVDGAWNAGSVEALKRFQKDQNLDPDGKIGSLSLIALGLGPKRGGAAAQSSPSSSQPIEPPPIAQPR